MRKLLLSTIALAALVTGCRQQVVQDPTELRRQAVLEKEIADRLAKRYSVVYPYSVISGGVEDAEDVLEAMGRDSEVAAHYANVNVKALRAARISEDTRAYVSFRKAGKVYWTRRPVHLAQGERILTDGVDCVRGRCGNRVSWSRRSPVLPEGEPEPDSAEFITPGVRGQSMEELPVPPIIGELMPSQLPPNGLPPTITTGKGALIPGFLGGGIRGGGVSGGSGGSARGGGGGVGGDVWPGDAIGDATHITGGPVLVAAPGIAAGVPFTAALPGVPPVIHEPPGMSTVIWAPDHPYVPTQVAIGAPWNPVVPAPQPFIWNPAGWLPPNGSPPSGTWPADSPSGPPSLSPRAVPLPPDSPPAGPPPGKPGEPGNVQPPPSSEVPEPATLLTAGLVFVLLFRRMRLAGYKPDRSTS